MGEKLKKFWKWVASWADDLGVYFATLCGVLISQYAPLLLKQGPISAPFEWLRLGISAIVAFYVVISDESGGDREGKRANFKRRVASAFAHGIAWNTLMGIAGQAAGAGGTP